MADPPPPPDLAPVLAGTPTPDLFPPRPAGAWALVVRAILRHATDLPLDSHTLALSAALHAQGERDRWGAAVGAPRAPTPTEVALLTMPVARNVLALCDWLACDAVTLSRRREAEEAESDFWASGAWPRSSDVPRLAILHPLGDLLRAANAKLLLFEEREDGLGTGGVPQDALCTLGGAGHDEFVHGMPRAAAIHHAGAFCHFPVPLARRWLAGRGAAWAAAWADPARPASAG